MILDKQDGLTFAIYLSILRAKEQSFLEIKRSDKNHFDNKKGMDYIMNYIKASVISIDTFESITLVGFSAAKEVLTMMSLELDSSLQIGSAVILAVKATTVSLAREKSPMLSISNQLSVRIRSIDEGELLSRIKLSFEGTLIESVITKNSAVRMGLKPEDEIVALVKASDLAIAEIL
jgi:molybdopterin-binding protein